MRIAIITEFREPYFSGGGERRYLELAKRLVKKGHDVTWISMKQRDSPRRTTLEGITCIHIGPRIRNPPRRTLLQFLRFQAALKLHLLAHSYDVVDAQAFNPILPAYYICKIKRTPFLATIYDVASDEEDQWLEKGWLARRAEKFVYTRNYKHVLTISTSAEKALQQKYGVKNTHLVYCGTDPRTVDRAKKQQASDLIMVARMTAHKHPEDFIQLVKNLKAKAVIIGDGPLKQTVQESIKGLDITFLQNLSYEEVLGYIKASKLLVLPSTREGFGIVLVEASAAKIPVLAYECTGVIDVVKNGETGYLVKPRDITALTAYARKLLKDKKMGLAGRKRVEKFFTWDAAADELEKVYKKVAQ